MLARKSTISYRNIVVSNISSHYVIYFRSKNKHRSISIIIFISLLCLQLQYQKREFFVSKYGYTDFEENSISIAQDKRFSTSRNSINHKTKMMIFNQFLNLLTKKHRLNIFTIAIGAKTECY